jgi:hypothetical protein
MVIKTYGAYADTKAFWSGYLLNLGKSTCSWFPIQISIPYLDLNPDPVERILMRIRIYNTERWIAMLSRSI